MHVVLKTKLWFNVTIYIDSWLLLDHRFPPAGRQGGPDDLHYAVGLLADFAPDVQNNNETNEQKAHNQNGSWSKLQTGGVGGVIFHQPRVLA